MISLEIGVAVTIIGYLVIVTAYVVSLRKDINNLQNRHDSFESYLQSLKELREDFVRLETKIEIFLNLQKDEIGK